MQNCYPVHLKANKRVGCSGKDWVIKERVGEDSVHAKVYGACCKEICDYVMKVESADTSKEIDMQIIASDHGLAPPIVDSFMCGDSSFIVMEALNQTAFDLMLRYMNPKIHRMILESCFEVLDKFHSYGYAHGDSHLNNFMVKYDSENLIKSLREPDPLKSYLLLQPKYFLIDFGYSGAIDEGLSIREDYIKAFLHLNNHYEKTLPDRDLPEYAPVLEYIMYRISEK